MEAIGPREVKGAKAVCFKADVGVLSEVHAMFDASWKSSVIDLRSTMWITGMALWKWMRSFWTRIYLQNWRFPYRSGRSRQVAKGTKGQIINISSNHAPLAAGPMPQCGSNKAATKFTKKSNGTAPHGIRNAIAPGHRWADRASCLLAKTHSHEGFADREIARVLFESEYPLYITESALRLTAEPVP